MIQTSSADRIEDLLEQILAWTRVGNYAAAKQILLDNFGDAKPEERLSYQLLDGTRSQKDVLEICLRSLAEPKISRSGLSAWVTKWEKLGLVQKAGSNVKRLFSLPDFQLAVPAAKSDEGDQGKASA
jgi:hypothetical protein